MALTLHGTVSDNTVALDRKTATPIVINGDMQIAQRSTSVTGKTSGDHYTVDRFKQDIGSMGTWSISQATDSPTGQGFNKSLKMDCTTADASPSSSDNLIVQTSLEGQDLQVLKKGTSSAESVTFSFWVKSAKTGTYILELWDRDNDRQIAQSYTISSADTWEKKVLSFAGDTTGALDNDNATSLQFNFWVSAGSNFTSGTLNTTWNSETAANRAVGQVNLNGTANNYIQWTGVQLEASDTASDFEFLPHDVNLNRCLRYYYQDTAFLDITVVRVSDSSRGVHKTLPVPMRTTPTFTATSTNEIGNTSMNNSSNKSVRFSMSGSADNHPRYAAYNFSAEL